LSRGTLRSGSNVSFSLSLALGWQDVKQAYRRSVVGPFWLTLGMAAQIATIGVVFGLIFKSPLTEYLPFLASSIIIWGFIGGTLTESCLAFVNAESMIRQMQLPLLVHVGRVIWKNIVTLLHNVAIIPIVFISVGFNFDFRNLLAIPGVLLLTINLVWLGFVLAFVSSRFRDMPPIIASVMTIAFYVTPVMWYPSQIPEEIGTTFLNLNPFFHLIQLVRAPLLGVEPSAENWIVSGVLAVLGWIVVLTINRKFKHLVPYWV
jgi:ABC-type polysaccharide/polyol phosphate export permease